MEQTLHALLFVNFQRQVIFVNSQLLQLLNRPESNSRLVIGKLMEDILGIETETAKSLLQDVSKTGSIHSRPLTLQTANGSAINVYSTIEATYNEKGECIGADLSFRQSAEQPKTSASSNNFDTGDRSFLPLYVTSQLDALRTLLIRIGGPRLGQTLERIVNETTERNNWPLKLNNGKLEKSTELIEPAIYHALLVKAIHYAVSVIGAKIVEKQLKAGEAQMGAAAVKIAKQIGLHEIISE
jgi:hypothetical protein